MAIDYKKELENAARNMIFVHDPDSLIKVIVRMVVDKIKVSHASFFLYNKEKSAYLPTSSRGCLQKKIPLGMVSIDKDDLLIRFFRERKNSNSIDRNAPVVLSQAKEALNDPRAKIELKSQLSHVLYQMELLESSVCVPSYFRDELLGILLLGSKKNAGAFSCEELDFFTALNSHMAMAIRNAQLFRQLEFELDRKHQLFVRTTIALAAAIEAKDHYTHGHTTRVTSLSLEIGKRISQRPHKSLDMKFLENLHIASLLHDIGKIGIPEYILNKRGELTVGERNRIMEHPMIGVNILKPIKELEGSSPGVKYHHERYDGKGYPEGLKGEQIPLIASIISVADSFDAMTTSRPYRQALMRQEAIGEISGLSGRQFHPKVADTFLELCKEGKI